MHRFKEPFRGYLPPDSGLSCARQNLTADCGELQSKADIVAEATYRIVFRSAGMFAVDELSECWKIPNSRIFPCDRVLPALGDVGNRLPIDTDGDLVRLGFVPMDDEGIRGFLCRRIELSRFNAGNMNPWLEQFSRKQS